MGIIAEKKQTKLEYRRCGIFRVAPFRKIFSPYFKRAGKGLSSFYLEIDSKICS